jgi:hypothetical protein
VLPGPADVVEDGHDPGEQIGERLLAHGHPVPLDALAVIRIFGLNALQVSSALREPVSQGASRRSPICSPGSCPSSTTSAGPGSTAN